MSNLSTNYLRNRCGIDRTKKNATRKNICNSSFRVGTCSSTGEIGKIVTRKLYLRSTAQPTRCTVLLGMSCWFARHGDINIFDLFFLFESAEAVKIHYYYGHFGDMMVVLSHLLCNTCYLRVCITGTFYLEGPTNRLFVADTTPTYI